MIYRLKFIILFTFCALTASAQNVWIENVADQDTINACHPFDRIRVQIFDPYNYSSFDTIYLDYGGGTPGYDTLFIDSAVQFFDTTLKHLYDICSSYPREFISDHFKIKGKNLGTPPPPATEYYFGQSVRLSSDYYSWYHDSPTFILNYELVRCQDEPFRVNIFNMDANGDSVHFELIDLNSRLVIPDAIEVNPNTGEVTWAGTPDTGLYQFAVYIKEYRWSFESMGHHFPRFSILVTDSCQYLEAHDKLGPENLFETDGREFMVNVGESWQHSIRIAKGDWDSVTVKPSSELFLSFFNSDYTITDLTDSLEVSLQWTTDTFHWRHHPYIITYHVTAYKNGKSYHRVLTNAIYVNNVVGLEENPNPNERVSVYPNPFEAEVFINSSSALKQIEIFNAQGVLVKQHFGINTSSFDIKLDGLPSGLYFLRIKTEKGIVSRRIIKSLY